MECSLVLELDDGTSGAALIQTLLPFLPIGCRLPPLCMYSYTISSHGRLLEGAAGFRSFYSLSMQGRDLVDFKGARFQNNVAVAVTIQEEIKEIGKCKNYS